MMDPINDLREQGSRAFDQGDFRRAADCYAKAAELARREGQESAELSSWNMLARSWANAGEIQKSIEAATHLLARAREVGNRYHQMNAARLLASRMAALDVRNHWHEIRPLLLEGLNIARELGEQDQVVDHLSRLGEYAVEVGETDAALDWLQKALNEAETLRGAQSRSFYSCIIHQGFSILMRKQNRHEEALRHAETALGAALENGNPLFIANAQLTLAKAERARGDLAEALRLVEEVLPQARQKGWKDTELRAEYLRGEILREMGRPEDAEPSARRALALAREIKVKEEEVESLISLGRILLDLKRHAEADKVLREARRLAQERDYADHFEAAEQLLREIAPSHQERPSPPFRVGVTGHRHLEDGEDFTARSLREILKRLHDEHPDGIVALSALAEGADTLFAEIALDLRIPFAVVIPFECYEQDFPPGPARERFKRLLSLARDVHYLPYHDRSDDAYLAGGQWIVDHSDWVVAVWDGQPARGKGGTGDVVQYARQKGRPLVLINPLTQTVTEEHPSQEASDG